MNPRAKCLEELKALGFIFQEHGGKHDKWYSKELRYTVMVRRSHFTEDDTRMILQEVRHELKRQRK